MGNGLDISWQISQIQSHKYALEEGELIPLPSVGPRAKRSAEASELTVTISVMPPSEITSANPPKAILQRKLISFH